MSNVSSTAQLSIFNTVVDAIRSDVVLSARFPKSSFYEFEPDLKGFARIPLWVVKIPSTNQTSSTINNGTKFKDFTVDLMMKIDWLANDKAREYVERAIAAIESYESHFNDLGYYSLSVNIDSVLDEIEEQKKIVVGIIKLELKGAV